MAALTRQPISNILEGVAATQITMADKAMSGSGSRVSDQTNSAMTMITSVVRANTSGLALSKS
jgi:hypothetical protein